MKRLAHAGVNEFHDALDHHLETRRHARVGFPGDTVKQEEEDHEASALARTGDSGMSTPASRSHRGVMRCAPSSARESEGQRQAEEQDKEEEEEEKGGIDNDGEVASARKPSGAKRGTPSAGVKRAPKATKRPRPPTTTRTSDEVWVPSTSKSTREASGLVEEAGEHRDETRGAESESESESSKRSGLLGGVLHWLGGFLFAAPPPAKKPRGE